MTEWKTAGRYEQVGKSAISLIPYLIVYGKQFGVTNDGQEPCVPREERNEQLLKFANKANLFVFLVALRIAPLFFHNVKTRSNSPDIVDLQLVIKAVKSLHVCVGVHRVDHAPDCQWHSLFPPQLDIGCIVHGDAVRRCANQTTNMVANLEYQQTEHLYY